MSEPDPEERNWKRIENKDYKDYGYNLCFNVAFMWVIISYLCTWFIFEWQKSNKNKPM